MTGRKLKSTRQFSAREKALLITGAAVLAVAGLKLMVVDFPQRVAADRDIWLQQSVRDTLWLKGKSAVLTCLSQQNNGTSVLDEGVSALNLPETLRIVSATQKENTLFISISFREHAQLLEWLLQTEASHPVRVTMLMLNDTMDKADIILSGVACHDL